MAEVAAHGQVPNGVQSGTKVMQLAIDLPQSFGTRVNIHLTILTKSIMVFLATSDATMGGGSAALGSFVYAMPDRYNPSQPLSTTLYSLPSTLDFVTRLAKVLARRLSLPCYVGGGVDLSGATEGGSVEEETTAFLGIVSAVTKAVAEAKE